jgi:hypothetical protein
VGFAVGVVERSEVLPREVRTGDRIIGFASPGLRCNGYSLARAALLERAGMRLDAPAWPGSRHSLAYLDLDRLVRSTGAARESFCTACFTGEYPVPVPEYDTKHVLEPQSREIHLQGTMPSSAERA